MQHDYISKFVREQSNKNLEHTSWWIETPLSNSTTIQIYTAGILQNCFKS